MIQYNQVSTFFDCYKASNEQISSKGKTMLIELGDTESSQKTKIDTWVGYPYHAKSGLAGSVREI